MLRSKMCRHVKQNKALFKGLLSSPSQSLEDYIMSMSIVGTWATELEIIAMSHMLNVNILTYSDCAWKKYSGSLVDRLFLPIDGGIYLNHVNRNHYNVVESVLNTMLLPNGNENNCDKVVNTDIKTQKRMCNKEDHSSHELGKKRRKLWFQKQYQNNNQFRENILQKRKLEYLSQRESKLMKLKTKYKEVEGFKSKLKMYSKDKYETDEKHKSQKKDYSKREYSSNEKYREINKELSKEKYNTDKKHQEQLNERTKSKYKNNLVFQKKMREYNKTKYKADVVFQRKLREYSTTKYKTNDLFK